MKKRGHAFAFAFRGWRVFFREDMHGKIHLLAALIVIIAGILLQVSVMEWVSILLCIGLVVTLEMVNAALESALDAVHPERSPHIGKAKDMAAGAVLWASMISLVVACLIFIPRIENLITS